jgi:hypothetical protein
VPGIMDDKHSQENGLKKPSEINVPPTMATVSETCSEISHRSRK